LFMTLSACNRSDAPSVKQKTASPSKSIDAPGKQPDHSDTSQANEKSVAGSANTSAQDSPPIDPVFLDTAVEAGITAVLYCGGPNKDHILESTGSGVAMLDYDGDGLLDIYLVNAWQLDEKPSAVRLRGKNVLYRNLGGGRFEDVTDKAGVGDDGWGCGVCAG